MFTALISCLVASTSSHADIENEDYGLPTVNRIATKQTVEINGLKFEGTLSENKYVVTRDDQHIVNHPEVIKSNFVSNMGGDGAGTKIIVLDGNLHPKTTGNLNDPIERYKLRERNHGVSVARMVKSMCPEATMRYKTFKKSAKDATADFELFSESDADVISTSTNWYKFMGEESENFFNALQKVTDSGKIIFKSIGNDANKDEKYLEWLLSNVSNERFKGRIVLVAGTEYDQNGKESLYKKSNSPYGFKPVIESVLSAPAYGIPVIDANRETKIKNGTSYACPIAASSFLQLKSLMIKNGYQYSNDEILSVLKSEARHPVGCPEGDRFKYGNGVIDLKSSLIELARQSKDLALMQKIAKSLEQRIEKPCKN